MNTPFFEKPFNSTLILFLVFLTHSSFAQTNFLPGYVITNQGDSIQGYINAKDKKTYFVCSFKNSIDSPIEKYQPDQIKGFRINEGKYFISSVIMIDGVNRMVFLEYLVKGKADLFYFYDSEDHYLMQTETQGLIELTEKKRIVKNDGGTFEMPKRYKSKLKGLLSNSPEIQGQIETVSMNHKSLKKLAVNYHNYICDTEDCIVFEKPQTKLIFSYSLISGYSIYNIDLGTELTANKGSSFLYGGRFEVGGFLPWTEKISAGIDVAFQQFSTEYFTIKKMERILFALDGEEYEYINDDFYDFAKSELYADLKMFVLKLPLSINYTFLDGNIRPFMSAGLMNHIVLSQNENFLYHRFSDEFGKTVPSYQMGIIGSFGLKYLMSERSSIMIDLFYESTSNNNINQSLKLKNKQYGIRLGLQFN